MLIDSHCHLDDPRYSGELDEVLARARRADVGGMLTICTRLSEFVAVRALAEARDGLWCSVGVHPHNAAEEGVDDPSELVPLTDHPKVVAIGETGLDFHYDNSPRPDQRSSFARHIEACQETGLPLIVHTREADAETIRFLRDGTAGGQLRGVIHCFSTSRELAEKAVEFGFFISLSGIVTFNRSDELRGIVRDLPIARVLVETDAPYLAPVPKRGRLNEPAYVTYTAAKVAEVMGLEPAALAQRTTENFYRLFDKARPPVAR
jgi:TatD DNase family protein